MSRNDPVAAVYRAYAGQLRNLMKNRFGIPESETEGLLHDVFTSLLRNRDQIHDTEKWLIAAVCNRSRSYRRRAFGPELVALRADDGTRPPVEDGIALEQVLERLPNRAGEVLRLRYLEGLSGKEIARHYGMTVESVYVLIHRSLEQARALADWSES